ncbi:MAG: hypothetical protein ABID45_02260 [Patescibacteria group bacterium]
MESTLRKQIINEWADNQPLQQKIITLFEKVRDIPYGNINSRNPQDVYEQNKGTCSGKHELLKELYEEIGIKVKKFLIVHHFNDLSINFPKNIKSILERDDIIDFHNFIKILVNDNWVTIDATWDKPMKKLGFPANVHWNGKTNMNIAVSSNGKIFETLNPEDLKKEKLNKLPKKIQQNRKLFLQEATQWFDSLRDNKEI